MPELTHKDRLLLAARHREELASDWLRRAIEELNTNLPNPRAALVHIESAHSAVENAKACRDLAAKEDTR